MAKRRDSNKVRDEEREIETEAAYAGKGDIAGEEEGGDTATSYTMPGVEKDESLRLAQAAADEAQRFNSGEEENAGSGTEEMEDYD